MFDGIDPRSPTPLYEQIAARVRVAVAAGELKSGDALPSVRQLANDLRVNPATVQQAYRALSADGFVDRRHGQGTFVQDVPVMQREAERKNQAIDIARRALTNAARIGLTGEEILDALSEQIGAEHGMTLNTPDE